MQVQFIPQGDSVFLSFFILHVEYAYLLSKVNLVITICDNSEQNVHTVMFLFCLIINLVITFASSLNTMPAISNVNITK